MVFIALNTSNGENFQQNKGIISAIAEKPLLGSLRLRCLNLPKIDSIISDDAIIGWQRELLVPSFWAH